MRGGRGVPAQVLGQPDPPPAHTHAPTDPAPIRVRKAAGVSAELHFHDLRHTGNTLASAAGASTRELMTRMGHTSSRAALIYQHMTATGTGPSPIGSVQ
ncbi:tyrosine-type recombinase/integrase [Streptomyces sp. NPDC059262]|uniref:tyrosine-type recombinase/integrase n=1 Tax=Streptomyces sp. NPDC059262 TaxID=3346797 RepID=UPI0036AC44F5